MFRCVVFQDSGSFLCVIDDSNDHMLSVWDCAKGTKHAEIKVKETDSGSAVNDIIAAMWNMNLLML